MMDETILSFESFEEKEDFKPTHNNVFIDNHTFNSHQKPESNGAKLGIESEFMIPDLSPDMDDNNFSWLFRILPPEAENSQNMDHESMTFYPHPEDVPREHSENPVKTEKQDTNEFPDKTTMLMDPLLSEMDVSALFPPPEEIPSSAEILTPSTTDAENATESQTKRQFNTDNRNGGRDRARGSVRGRVVTPITRNSSITDTPILRRSQRKRNYLEMTNMHAKVTPELPSLKNKRLRKTIGQKEEQMATPSLDYKATEIMESIFETPKWEIDKPPSEIETMPSLKIVFRKIKPVNPIDTKLIIPWEYQKGVLNTDAHLASELYLKHSIFPRIVPTYETKTYVTDAITKTPLDITEIRKLMKENHMEKHNKHANLLAHGRGNVDHKESQAFPFLMDFVTNDFDILLTQQQSIFANIQVQLMEEKNTEQSATADETMNTTFVNFSNFNDYFDEPVEKQPITKNKVDRIVGAVPVSACAMTGNEKLFSKVAVFQHKGQLYRPNPLVIPLVRIPDEDILEIISKPTLPTLESPYYSALTTYFEAKSASLAMFKSKSRPKPL
ncbi:unnamed protein product [Orchesella dallaii]|uniref:Uncharacterized protein n=1 Tax=Orchesella dallaii TaxID=48710 RepID=A0ABP1QLE1_9HEXA